MSRLTKFARKVFLTSLLALSAESAFSQDAQTNQQPADSFAVRTTPLSFDDFVARRRQLEQDLANQRNMLNTRRAQLLRWNADDQQAFQASFGTADANTRAQVLGTIDRELALNSQMTANNFQETPVSRPGRFAYVYPNNPSTIYLDDQYYASAPTGRDSRAGTLVHEMSHFSSVGGTQDYVYGANNAAALSRNYANGTDPRQPARNADNVEYYSEGALGSRTQPANSQPQQPAQGPQTQQSPNTQMNGQPVGSAQLVMDDNAPRRGSSANQNPASNQTPASQPGMTQDQFRADMARINREFQQADAQNRQNPLSIPVPTTNQTAPVTDVPPAGTRPQTNYATYAPRNGYDEYGNRADSTRQQYDDQGYRAQPRQNGVYGSDGSYRPIGTGSNVVSARQRTQQMIQQSQAQIAAQQSNANWSSAIPTNDTGSGSNGFSNSFFNNVTGNTTSNANWTSAILTSNTNSSSSTNTNTSYQSNGYDNARIVYDENAPRRGMTGANSGSSTGSNSNANSSGIGNGSTPSSNTDTRQHGRFDNTSSQASMPASSNNSNSSFNDAPQRPLGGGAVYDHSPGQSGLIQTRPAGQSAPTANISSTPAIQTRQPGTSSATASLNLGF